MAFYHRMPLSLRVPLMAAGLMVVVGIVAAQFVIAALIRSQERQLRELAQLEFDALATSLGPFVVRDDTWEMFDILDRAIQREGPFRAVRATLVDARGRVIASSAPDLHPLGSSGVELIGGATPVERISYDRATETVDLRSVLTYQGRSLAQIVITFDARDLAADRLRAWLLLALGNAGATLVLALAGYAVVRRLLAPVGRLAAAMDQPTGTPHPIPESMIPSGDTELSRLYHTYNGMIRAVEARNEAERRLAERERFVSLGRLAGSLAHEINNPLGGLLNAVDTVRRYPDRPDVVRASADLLDRGLKQMRDMVGATLDTHRTDYSAAQLSATDFEDLHVLIRPEVEHRAQKLDWDVDLPATAIERLPSGPVRQVVLNLLLNATAISGQQGALGLRARAEDTMLDIGVWDSGPGLPEAVRRRLLSDDPLEPGGGLGLRLVRQLVLGLGGEVSLGCTPDGRNEVLVRLPLAAAGKGAADA